MSLRADNYAGPPGGPQQASDFPALERKMTPFLANFPARLSSGLAGLMLAAAGLAGCSSTPAGPAQPQRVGWRDYRSGHSGGFRDYVDGLICEGEAAE